MDAIKVERQQQKALRAQQFSDALIPIEKEAYALAEKEYHDRNTRYCGHSFDTWFNYYFAKLIIANKDILPLYLEINDEH
jgi:hypothetical protein